MTSDHHPPPTGGPNHRLSPQPGQAHPPPSATCPTCAVC